MHPSAIMHILVDIISSLLRKISPGDTIDERGPRPTSAGELHSPVSRS